jgi:hypothetical protein
MPLQGVTSKSQAQAPAQPVEPLERKGLHHSPNFPDEIRMDSPKEESHFLCDCACCICELFTGLWEWIQQCCVALFSDSEEEEVPRDTHTQIIRFMIKWSPEKWSMGKAEWRPEIEGEELVRDFRAFSPKLQQSFKKLLSEHFGLDQGAEPNYEGLLRQLQPSLRVFNKVFLPVLKEVQKSAGPMDDKAGLGATPDAVEQSRRYQELLQEAQAYFDNINRIKTKWNSYIKSWDPKVEGMQFLEDARTLPMFSREIFSLIRTEHAQELAKIKHAFKTQHAELPWPKDVLERTACEWILKSRQPQGDIAYLLQIEWCFALQQLDIAKKINGIPVQQGWGENHPMDVRGDPALFFQAANAQTANRS